MRRDVGNIIILGAGPTGLGAAFRLLESGFRDFLILEQQPLPGGLASSIVDPQGFTWDLGGHVQFSHYPYYDGVLDRVIPDWLYHERESSVWIAGRFVPYPFQNNIRHLDRHDRERILGDMRKLSPTGSPTNFKEWIARTFGDSLAEMFLLPYNFKVWGYPLETLGVSWMGERVAVPDIARIERNIARGEDDVSWGPNNRFRFPLRGGTGAIWQAVAETIPREHFRFNCTVQTIDAGRRQIETSNRSFDYTTLISTMPLDLLCAQTLNLEASATEAARQLVHSSVHIVGIGLEGALPETLARKCWMYFPERQSPYYRVTVFSNYSPHHVPDSAKHWSLMAEVCETAVKPVDRGTLMERTLAALRADGMIPGGAKVVSTWQRRLGHGYPTPFLGRDGVLNTIHTDLEAKTIFSRGRFGAWKYEVSNQDHSFMQGVELADRLLNGTREKTFAGPAESG